MSEPLMGAAEFNRRLAEARAAVEADVLPELTRRYRQVLRTFGRRAAAAYRNRAVVASARHDELYDPDQLEAEVAARTARLRRATVERIIEGVLVGAGISFDTAPLLVPHLLEHIGIRARDLNASMQDSLRRTIETATAEGWTVPETAAAISRGVDAMAAYTAEALARTDLIGLANGGSYVAARGVLGEGATKTWLSAEDDRVRPTHEDADGQTVPLDQQFQVGDDLLDYPGDPQGSDEEVINCRCTVIYNEASEGDGVTAAASGPDVSGLAMIAVYPRPDEQQAISREGGQAPDTIHCTMVFLGEVANLDMQQVRDCVAEVAAQTAPMSGRIGGLGAFAGGPDGAPQIALPNVQGLAQLRTRLTDALAARGVESPSEHDWVPHITVAYADAPEMSDHELLGMPLTFDHLTLTVADERSDWPLRPDGVTASGHDVGVHDEEARMGNGNPAVGSVSIDSNGVTVTFGGGSGGGIVTTTVETGVTAAVQMEEPVTDAQPASRWVSDLAFDGTATADGRFIVAPGTPLPNGSRAVGMGWRDLPLSLMAQTRTADGHDGAEVSGRIDTIFRDTQLDMDGNALPEGVSAFRSTGVFDSGEFGAEIGRMVEDEMLRGVSVDLSITDYMFRDPETGDLLDPDTMSEDAWERAFFGELQFAIVDAQIMAATVCATPAFDRARLAVTASDDGRSLQTTLWAPIRLVTDDAITASAAGVAPVRPPREWFDDPQLDELTPVTVTPDGRIYGHFADWTQCHTGVSGRCLLPPRGDDYSMFHLGSVTCDDGSEVAVGQVTMDVGHAGRTWSAERALAHYDNTGTAVAHVRVGEDRFGPWMAGSLLPDVSEAKVRAFKGAKPSGDWRPMQGVHRLINILSVNVPGFPVKRERALLASAAATLDGGTPSAADEVPDPHLLRVLAARAESGIRGIADIAG